jgi:hypothetical protein
MNAPRLKMTEHFLLYCDATRDVFTLEKAGTDIRHQFSDLRTALDYASGLVTEETPIRLCNEYGRIMVESVILPNGTKTPTLKSEALEADVYGDDRRG